MPLPLAFHKVDDRFEWGFTRNNVYGFKRIIDYLDSKNYRCDDEDFEISFDDGFESVFTNAFPELKETNLRSIVFVIAGNIGGDSKWDVYPGSLKFKHLDAAQLRGLSDKGVLIGSHTMSHKNLQRMENSNIKYELQESKKIIEDIIDRPVDSICYPFGRYDKRIIELAIETGYEKGYLFLRDDSWDTEETEYLSMLRERIPIYLFDTPLSIMLKFNGLWHFENFKGKIIKSYNIFSDYLLHKINTLK